MKMVINFSGSVEIDPNKVTFIKYIYGKPGCHVIHGDEYITLSEEEKAQYVLESLSECLEDGDCEYEVVDVEVYE